MRKNSGGEDYGRKGPLKDRKEAAALEDMERRLHPESNNCTTAVERSVATAAY